MKLHQPDWNPWSHSVLGHFVLNAYGEPLDVELPLTGDGSPRLWRRWIDTSLDSPNDIVPWETASPVPGSTYRAAAHSVVVLLADAGAP